MRCEPRILEEDRKETGRRQEGGSKEKGEEDRKEAGRRQEGGGKEAGRRQEGGRK
jgi:hypothetical protein